MGMILFVHGMGHSDDRNYWRKWVDPVRSALAAQGLELDEGHFGGVYYYDLVPCPQEKMAQKAESIKIQLLYLKERVTEELGSLRSPFPKGIGAIKKLADQIVDNFGDIFTYLYLEEIHQAVNQRLYDAFDGNGPFSLVGYSLGSLVSYCALKENPAAARQVVHLIMLGSPLFWFRRGVAERVDLDSRPAVGRFTNIAGILDIACPQVVPRILGGLDESIEFSINPFDPIKGHQEYFYKEEGLEALASVLRKGWVA